MIQYLPRAYEGLLAVSIAEALGAELVDASTGSLAGAETIARHKVITNPTVHFASRLQTAWGNAREVLAGAVIIADGPGELSEVLAELADVGGSIYPEPVSSEGQQVLQPHTTYEITVPPLAGHGGGVVRWQVIEPIASAAL